MHIPNGSTPVTTFAPVDVTTSIAGVTPRYPGSRYNYDHETITVGTDVPDQGTFTMPYPGRLDRDGDGPAGQTDQAYWQAIEATDTNHRLNANNTLYWADAGDMSVTFGASAVTIRNTSGATWSAGEFDIRLDRRSYLDSELPVDTSIASPLTVPLPRPETGSGAFSALTGLRTREDFLGQLRPDASLNTIGALLGN